MISGIGLRSEHFDEVLETHPKIDFLEIISENFTDSHGYLRNLLEKLRQDYPFACHGVSLSIGSTSELDQNFLKQLKYFSDFLQPWVVSDHLCWTGAHARSWFDLLPLPFTKESVENTVSRIQKAQEVLARPLAMENISTYLNFSKNEMSEHEFIRQVVQQSGCQLLLDVNNIYVNSINHGFDAYRYIRNIPAEAVVQYHLAGHENRGDFLFDTHDQPIDGRVWRLFEYALEVIGPRPTLIERDAKLPTLNELVAEADHAKILAIKKMEQMQHA